MYGTQMLGEDDIQQTLAGLRRGREALAALRRRTPCDSPLYAQTRYVITAIDGMAETLTGDPEYFWLPVRRG
ncbi:MAG: hypothetical protein GC201_04075 [Alphaproteobacteria bacterium]|nr:hypothetical protein [Alphaproteobacteria bacterium]